MTNTVGFAEQTNFNSSDPNSGERIIISQRPFYVREFPFNYDAQQIVAPISPHAFTIDHLTLLKDGKPYANLENVRTIMAHGYVDKTGIWRFEDHQEVLPVVNQYEKDFIEENQRYEEEGALDLVIACREGAKPKGLSLRRRIGDLLKPGWIGYKPTQPYKTLAYAYDEVVWASYNVFTDDHGIKRTAVTLDLDNNNFKEIDAMIAKVQRRNERNRQRIQFGEISQG